jgi:hypothetical protein
MSTKIAHSGRKSMPKKNVGGLIAFATGVAAGAAALFLSKKENRQMVKAKAVKAGKKVKQVAAQVKKNPKKFAKQAVSKAVKTVKAKAKVVAKKRR